MIPPGSEPAASEPAKPVELSAFELERLRLAGGWARFLAIIGFILTGLLGLAFIGIVIWQMRLWGRLGGERMAAVFAPALVLLAATTAASVLVWNYGRSIVSFFRQGEPALTRAFRNLRHFLKLWTLLLALTTVVKIVTVLRRMM